MKLAIISSRYPDKASPYNHMFVHVRALYFKSRGIELKVFVPSKSNNSYQHEGIEVKLGSADDIIKELNSFDIYNVHLLNFFPLVKDGGLKIYKFLAEVNKPVILGIHGADVFKYPEYLFDFSYSPHGIAKFIYKNYWNYPHIRNFIRHLNQRSDSAVIFPSNWMKEYTERLFEFKLANPKVVANGIDTELFDFKDLFENRYKLMTLRPFEKKYGIEQAIEVMRFLPDKFTLDIYGKGKDKDLYQKLIAQFGLEERVKIFERFIDRKNMPELFHRYGMFFALTLFDSQGVSMCEAMASGLLTISNPITAIPEFVKNDQTGLLGMTAPEIADSILRVSQEEIRFTTITQAARTFMETLDWKKTGERELEVLKSVKYGK